MNEHGTCLLYTSDAADERSSVDLGGRRIIKKKKQLHTRGGIDSDTEYTNYYALYDDWLKIIVTIKHI